MKKIEFIKKINKRTVGIVLTIMILFSSGVLIGYKTHNKIIQAETHFKEKKQYIYRNNVNEEIKQKLASYEPIKENEQAWYSKYSFISHAAGRLDGKIYTNSKEAYENSYQKGNRVFDADVRFTQDGVLVLRHAWIDDLEQDNITKTEYWADDVGQSHIKKEEVPFYEEFIQTKIFNKYTPMSFEDVLDFMKEHEDVYIAVDSKENIEKTYDYIVKMAKNKGEEQLLDRIIVSFYKYEDYDKIKNIYNFKNWTIRQQFVYHQNYYELAEFCVKNQIPVINISASFLDAGDDISILLEKNIKLYVAVVDSVGKMERYVKQGATGAITNDLYESDMSYIKK